MTKTAATLRNRIAVRAYYLHINAAPGSDVDHWLTAGAIEIDIAAKRSQAAKKAAVTRKGKVATTATIVSFPTKTIMPTRFPRVAGA